MTGKLFTTVAAGAIFATASVFAPAAFAQSSNAPSTSTPLIQTAPAASDTVVPSYLTAQSPDQVSANTYIGQSVYNGSNESIGKVNDLIMEKQGGIVAAVVGVGGFLGIGEKNVAVPINNITIAQNTQDGTVKLTTSETADSLKAAPEFKTLEMQSAEKAPSTTMSTDKTTTSSTTSTAPATTTAPATNSN